MFKIKSVGSAKSGPIEYYTANVALEQGEAVVLSSGELVLATGTTVPEFVTVGIAKADELCAVQRIMEDMAIVTTLSAAGTALNLGDKVTLHASNGKQVTATTTDGIFEISEFLTTAKASGDGVVGYFRR